MDLVRRMMILTIENGWKTGFGPDGLAYSAISDDVLLGSLVRGKPRVLQAPPSVGVGSMAQNSSQLKSILERIRNDTDQALT